jgi:hypothetical protein
MSSSKHPSGRNVVECLEKVTDYETFRDFVWTLIDEREAAEEMERADPEKWRYGGAIGWQHADISQYLAAGISNVVDAACLSRGVRSPLSLNLNRFFGHSTKRPFGNRLSRPRFSSVFRRTICVPRTPSVSWESRSIG